MATVSGTLARSPVYAPGAPVERIQSLDILRGFALFGVLLINMEFFVRPIETAGYGIESGLTGANHAVAWLQYLLQGKFWTLFAMLFGMGFAVMLQRAQAAGRAFAVPYLRRSALLLVFGAAHVALVWAGDILHTYAIAACVLLAMLLGRPWWLLLPVPAFLAAWLVLGGRGHLGGVIGFLMLAAAAARIRGGGPQRLWQAGAALYLTVSLVVLGFVLPRVLGGVSPELQAAIAGRVADWQAGVGRAAEVNATGSYFDNVLLRVRFVADGLADETRLLVYVVGLFLIGFWFVRSGLVVAPRRHRRKLARVAIAGIAAGLPLALASTAVSPRFEPSTAAMFPVASSLGTIASLPLSVGMACALLWAVQAGVRLAWLAPVGRMALSNYLLQSIVCTWLFMGYGAGLAGSFSRLGQLALVVGLFALQLACSRWWLRHFRFGPAEWLWRAATYATWPPMRRAAGNDAAAGTHGGSVPVVNASSAH